MHQISSEETYEDGQVIFDEGSHGDWIYMIDSGSVELLKRLEGELVIIETLGEGEIFGEIAYISGMPRTAMARAKGPTVVSILDRSFLDDEFNKLSDSFQQILKRLAYRFKETTDAALRLHARRKQKRVAKVLSLSFKSGSQMVQAFSENINADGMFIRTSNLLPVGQPFTLKLQLPDGDDPLNIGCEVSWHRPQPDPARKLSPGMGIRFTRISDQDRQLLRQALKQAGG